MFCKKGVFRNFAKFTGKHLCQSLFFNKVAGEACNFIKKETLVQLFSCEFCEISKNTFFYRTPPVAASVKTVPEKHLFLFLPYRGPLSFQTRTKLRKSLKCILNCCKLQIVFKSQNKLAKAFRFKEYISKELTGNVDKSQCGLCNESYYGECVGHLNVRTGEHIGISPLTEKKVKSKGGDVNDPLLLCNQSPSFENFSVPTK